MRRFLLLAIAAGACGGKHDDPPAAVPSGSAAASRCVQLPFAESSPVPEASGAAWFTIDGKPELVVISDSGNAGAYAVVDPDTGETREQGKLPLGDAGEDLEGMASRGDELYGLTSSGWIRAWRRDGAGFALADGPYALGPVDLPNKGSLSPTAPATDGMVCGAHASNCGRNYEGLCLVPQPVADPLACTGFAASKADGHLYCLTDAGDGKLVIHHDRAIAIAHTGMIADCAFDEAGTLYVGSNLFDLNRVYTVSGWADPKTAKVAELAQIGVGFPEVLAVRGDVFYRMSDTGGAPSLMAKFRCTR